MGEAQKFTGAGMVMSAGIASVAVNAPLAAADATGHTLKSILLIRLAGVEGWDKDGNYVCSQFVFNFDTMEIFDGSKTHHINDISGCEYRDEYLYLSIKGRNRPKSFILGHSSRSARVLEIIEMMMSGKQLYNDGIEGGLKSVVSRRKGLSFGTLLRLAIRSIIIGPILFFYNLTYAPADLIGWSNFYAACLVVFFASLSLRFLYPVKSPQWSAGERDEQGNGYKFSGIFCLLLSAGLYYYYLYSVSLA